MPPKETPDGRPGFLMMLSNPKKENKDKASKSHKNLKDQLVERIAECILTAPTAAVFNGMPEASEKIPVKLHFFGDGYEYQKSIGGRSVWAIPIMGGEFIIEEEVGCIKGIAGGNFFIMADSVMAALVASEAAVEAIMEVKGAITPFPGGIVASGSKVGSKKYKFMGASTNELYCPTLREKIPDSKVPAGVNGIFEIVIDGSSEGSVGKAMAEGIRAACRVPGVKLISAGNYGGSLGPFKFELHKLLSN